MKWKHVIVQCLSMVGLNDCLTGLVACPDVVTDPCAATNWHANDKVVHSFLGLKLCEEEQEFIEGKVTVVDMWNTPKSHHKQERPITQILLIQDALNICYLKTEFLSTVSTKFAGLNGVLTEPNTGFSKAICHWHTHKGCFLEYPHA